MANKPRVKGMSRKQRAATMIAIREQQAGRSPRAVSMDARQTARRSLDPETDDLYPWQRHPNRYDVQGVDDGRVVAKIPEPEVEPEPKTTKNDAKVADVQTEPTKPIGFRADHTLIDRELAMRAHSGTSWTPERRGEMEIAGFVSDVERIYADLMRSAKTDEERAIVEEEVDKFQKGYAQKWNAQMAAQSRCISSMITGASRFPTRTAEKANTSYDKRITETNEYRGRAINAIQKKLKAHRIEEAGGESEVMKQKLAVAEEAQVRMKAVNKILRHKKTSDDEKIKQVHDKFGLSEHLIHELMTPDWGKPGYESWQLSNNNANIKRMKERIEEMEVKETTPTTEVTFADGTIIDNREDDRVQIDFDEKPDDAMLSKLKGAGWRWAPSLRVWQRKRTNAAMYSAKHITGVS